MIYLTYTLLKTDKNPNLCEETNIPPGFIPIITVWRPAIIWSKKSRKDDQIYVSENTKQQIKSDTVLPSNGSVTGELSPLNWLTVLRR